MKTTDTTSREHPQPTSTVATNQTAFENLGYDCDTEADFVACFSYDDRTGTAEDWAIKNRTPDDRISAIEECKRHPTAGQTITNGVIDISTTTPRLNRSALIARLATQGINDLWLDDYC